MTKSKYFDEISRLLFRINNYRLANVKQIIRKRYFFILFHSFLILFATFALLSLIKVPEFLYYKDYPKYFIPAVLLAFSIYHNSLSVWVITRKFTPLTISDFKIDTVKRNY